MTTKNDTEQQRADFEAWMRKERPDYPLEFSHGVYYYSPQQRMFEAYQAGRAALQSQPLTVDALAQEIRRVNGNNALGAGALAEALMPFLESALQSQDRDEGYRAMAAEYQRWIDAYHQGMDYEDFLKKEARRIEGDGE